MVQPREGWIESDEGRLHYVDWEGDGPAVVFVHGLTANARSFDALAKGLTPQNRVVALDLRGRSLSTKPSAGHYGLEAHVRDLSALIRSLGLGPVALLGHSLGTFVIATFAGQHPELVSRVVLIDGGGLTAASTASVVQGIQSSISRLSTVYPSYEAYLEFWQKMPFLRPWHPDMEALVAADAVVRSDGTVISSVSPVAVQEDMHSVIHDYDMEQVLERVKVPALVLWAPVGVVTPDQPLLPRETADRVAGLLSQGRLVEIEGANHYTIGYAPACIDHVKAFLAGR